MQEEYFQYLRTYLKCSISFLRTKRSKLFIFFVAKQGIELFVQLTSRNHSTHGKYITTESPFSSYEFLTRLIADSHHSRRRGLYVEC